MISAHPEMPSRNVIYLSNCDILSLYFFHLSSVLVVAMPELLRSGKLAVEKGQAQGRNEIYVKQLTDYIVPALVEALHKVRVFFARSGLGLQNIFSGLYSSVDSFACWIAFDTDQKG